MASGGPAVLSRHVEADRSRMSRTLSRRMVEHGNPHEEIRAELEFQIGRRRRCEFAAHLQSPDAVLPLGTSSNVSSIAGAFLDQTPGITVPTGIVSSSSLL